MSSDEEDLLFMSANFTILHLLLKRKKIHDIRVDR